MLVWVRVVHCAHCSGLPVKGHLPCSASTACKPAITGAVALLPIIIQRKRESPAAAGVSDPQNAFHFISFHRRLVFQFNKQVLLLTENVRRNLRLQYMTGEFLLEHMLGIQHAIYFAVTKNADNEQSLQGSRDTRNESASADDELRTSSDM